MKVLDWNDLSDLGLIIKINHEVLHPLGLAMSRNPEDGTSSQVLVSENGIWEYPEPMTRFLESTTTEDFKLLIQNKVKEERGESNEV